ncbi:MAG: SDR family oxidoreductase [Chloroflexi bacterium]|nr:SDR family oxidoreductase [Chloroflexota bacterium]
MGATLSEPATEEVGVRVQDKVAFVTGGGSGIGRAIAKTLAREGAKVAVCDVSEQGAAQTVQEIADAKGTAITVRADVTSFTGVNEAVHQAVDRLGPVDILVSCAGWDEPMPFDRTDEPFWDKVIAINYKGHVICTRAVLDTMIERQYGKLVYISSDAGRVGSSGEAIYAGAKAGVIGFCKTIARETARYKLNANVVCPGPTETPLLAGAAQLTPNLYNAMKRAIPFRRFAQPQEIANAVLFFASDEAAYITGQVLSVSGGLTMVG